MLVVINLNNFNLFMPIEVIYRLFFALISVAHVHSARKLY